MSTQSDPLSKIDNLTRNERALLYKDARAAAERATDQADQIATENGWELGGGLWDDEVHDLLYHRRTELGQLVYEMAREIVNERDLDAPRSLVEFKFVGPVQR